MSYIHTPTYRGNCLGELSKEEMSYIHTPTYGGNGPGNCSRGKCPTYLQPHIGETVRGKKLSNGDCSTLMHPTQRVCVRMHTHAYPHTHIHTHTHTYTYTHIQGYTIMSDHVIECKFYSAYYNVRQGAPSPGLSDDDRGCRRQVYPTSVMPLQPVGDGQ